jgi:tight adherence protein C
MVIFILLLVFAVTFGILFLLLHRGEGKELEDKVGLEERVGLPRTWVTRLSPLLRGLALTLKDIQKLNNYRAKMKERFLTAGLRGLSADEFMALKITLSLAVPLIGAFLIGLVDIFYIVLMVLGGFFFPDLWLRDRVERRKRAIQRNLPDMLDLLTLSVEAGLDFAAAIGKIVQRSKASPLNEELFLMLQEIQMGTSRREALRHTTKRIALPDFSSFGATLIQAEELGASIGPVLRGQSEEMRVKRSQRAERLAHTAPLKLLIPLLGFIFPAVFIMLFGPIIIAYWRTAF